MNNKLNKIKLALQRLIAEAFAQVSTDKGILAWDGDSSMPEVGQSVYSFDEEGNQIAVEDGLYTLDDGTVIVVEGGKVKEIREGENRSNKEETPENNDEPNEDEPNEDEPNDEDVPNNDDNQNEPDPNVEEEAQEPEEEEPQADPRDERIANLEAEVARLEEENGALRERIAELENKPAAESAEEEFKKVNALPKELGNSKLNNLARILNA